jgi:hypothetical protein
MCRIILSALFAMSLALSLAGCAAVDDSKKSITYDKAMRHYERAIRWSDFKTANSFRRPAAGTVQPREDTLKNIKVTGYEQTGIVLSDEDIEVQLTVEIVYYRLDGMKLLTVTDVQDWKYDAELKAWYITSPLPAFK